MKRFTREKSELNKIDLQYRCNKSIGEAIGLNIPPKYKIPASKNWYYLGSTKYLSDSIIDVYMLPLMHVLLVYDDGSFRVASLYNSEFRANYPDVIKFVKDSI